MGFKVIEGTWEEVARNWRELAGLRVRVTVLDAVAEPGLADATDTSGMPVRLSPETIHEVRSPGPFLEAEAMDVPADLPRPGMTIPRSCIRDQGRLPDLSSAE